jgi:hypothetical protein
MGVSSQMRKWKSNRIVEAIKAVGLDPRQFDLQDDDGTISIKHRWSPSCFIIRPKGMHSAATSVVGDGGEWPISASSWETIYPRISGWLAEVKLDLETPDLWAELQQETRLFGAISDDVTGNTPFTSDELNEIAARLQALAEHARHTYNLSAAQVRALDTKIDYLVNAARRLNRIDWLNACVGALLGYVLSASLPPEAARDMLLGFARAIGHLCGLSDLPPLVG